jgi:hypothetical protein
LGWLCIPLYVFCPLLIPATSIQLRAIAAFVAIDIVFSSIDYLRASSRRDGTSNLREYVRFLVPFPLLAIVFPDHKRRQSADVACRHLFLTIVAGFSGAVIAVQGLSYLSRSPLVQENFALNHFVMLLTFVLALESLARTVYALEQLAGFDTLPLAQNVILSRTVAEFWQRYNYRVHDWLYHNVFRAVDGRHAPVRATLAVFFVSAILHEVMFAIATSRLTGYQFLFFMVQAPAVLVSRPLESFARRSGVLATTMAHGITALFLGVTSILFFHGLHLVFPFIYVSPSPLP